MLIDDSYKNKTPNKNKRIGTPDEIDFIILHETASSTGDPRSTLNYNLRADVKSSYHYLIARDGVVFCYLNPDEYIAWHAGSSSFKGVEGYSLNVKSIGIEFDGPNNGTPFTLQQLKSGKELISLLCDKYKIPLENITTHAIVAPTRKTDPKGATLEQILLPDNPVVVGVGMKMTMAAFVGKVKALKESDAIFIYKLAYEFNIDHRFLCSLISSFAEADVGVNNPLGIILTEENPWYETYKIGLAMGIIILKNECAKKKAFTLYEVCSLSLFRKLSPEKLRMNYMLSF